MMRQAGDRVVAGGVLAWSAVLSANWPAWRGPSADGVSPETNLPVKWSPTENIAWKLALPQWSGATPIIWGDTIFLNVAESDLDTLSLWAVSAAVRGRCCWKRQLSKGNNKQRKQNMSSPSPVTDGTTVWAMTGTGFVRAFDFAGNELWMRDIQKDYGRFGLNWGYANSPLLLDGDLIVPVLHGMKTDDPSYLLRIDGKTGQTEVEGGAAEPRRFANRPTPTPRRRWSASATRARSSSPARDVVTGHDPATGKELWRADGLNPRERPGVPHRRLARRASATSSSRRRASVRCWCSAPAAAATSRPRTSCGSSTTGPTCRRRSPMAPTSTWSPIAASSIAST